MKNLTNQVSANDYEYFWITFCRIIEVCIFAGETSKLVGDYKFKWQKAEQDISTLQANVSKYCT